MTQINYWLKAPEWANAVIASKDGQEFYVSQFGGISARQRVGYSEVDHDHSADMIEPHCWTLIDTRQATWTGEGLPPVGTVCERNIARSDWCKTKILAVTPEGGNVAYQDMAGQLGWSGCASSFRPIRTPAQLAAEEREKAIEFMMQMTSSLGHSDVSKKILFGELYDKGLRFEVKP